MNSADEISDKIVILIMQYKKKLGVNLGVLQSGIRAEVQILGHMRPNTKIV